MVAGAGGFIGGHAVRRLVAEGFLVRAVDVKPLDEWMQAPPEHTEIIIGDLSEFTVCERAVDHADVIYNYAADMGGMGFIENNRALCMISVLINTNLIRAASLSGVRNYLFASSACVYRQDRQSNPDVIPLSETDAYPADPEDGYGWEKLFSERMCRHMTEDFGIRTFLPRYHNVYGPYGTYDGGRAKAPAAICRKVVEAMMSGSYEIEIWGDGSQTRSFTYIDDAIEGSIRLLGSNVKQPINMGSSELVSINQLVDLVESIAGVSLKRSYDLSKPQGVRGRNSDNTLIRQELDWEPQTPLLEGLTHTYEWVRNRMAIDWSGRETSVANSVKES